MPLVLSASAARTLMVAAQGLDRRREGAACKADVLQTIRRMGVLQIDTIHVVARAPYFALWSRLGAYEPRWLEELEAEGALFEYWAHEACFIPIEDYPLYRHRMADTGSLGWRYSHAWMAAHREVAERVLAHIREQGPVRAADFVRQGGKGNGWWDWKPEKIALESLFAAGELMVARRERFQRVYDLRERVLPGWSDAQLPPKEETQRALALKAVRALGVAREGWVADYFRFRKGEAREAPALLAGLAAEGALRAVQVAGWDGPCYLHPDQAGLAEEAASGALVPTLTTLLTPFDPLVWDRARTRAVFGFDYTVECYVPAPKRRYGYFCLPILRRGELIGRLDAKAHRTEGRFEVKALYLEPGVATGVGAVRELPLLAVDLAQALAECAAWHGTPEVVVGPSQPLELAGLVQRAILG